MERLSQFRAIVVISGNLPQSIKPRVQQFSDGLVRFREFVVSVVAGNDDRVGLGVKSSQEFNHLFKEVPGGNTLQQSLPVAENMQVGQLNNSKCHDDCLCLAGEFRISGPSARGGGPSAG
jgi:hypothetical protein